MEIEIGYKRLTAAAGGVRAEVVFPQLAGEGRGIARINAFYQRAAETWLARCAGEDALPVRLPAGRYTARLCSTAEVAGNRLTITLRWLLCRRGRSIEEAHCVHCWQLPRGYLQPPVAHAAEGHSKL